MKGQLKVMLLFFCVIMSVGIEVLADRDENTLKERAKVFWEARVNGDWATVYQYLSQEEKDKFTQEKFVSSRKEKGPFRFLSYELGGVESAGDLGWVEVRYAIQPLGYPEYPPRQMHLWDVWQKTGDWYPVPASRSAEFPKNPPRLRPVEEEVSLAARVNGFWEAKEKNDWSSVYQHLDPDFRAGVSAEEFLEKRAFYSYLNHRVEWAEVTGNHGRVKVTYTCRLKDPSVSKLDPVETSVVEEWIKMNNQWYCHIRKDPAE